MGIFFFSALIQGFYVLLGIGMVIGEAGEFGQVEGGEVVLKPPVVSQRGETKQGRIADIHGVSGGVEETFGYEIIGAEGGNRRCRFPTNLDITKS